MNTKLELILNEIGKEYEIDTEDLDPIKKKLKGKFILEVKDFFKMTKETWEKLGLPEPLFDYILEKCTQIKTDQSSVTPKTVSLISDSNIHSQKTDQSQSQKKTQEQNKELIDLNPVDLNNNINALLNKNKRKIPKEEKSISESKINPIFDILERIRSSLSTDRELMIDLFQSIHKLFQNIIDNPNENKFRKLKIGSKFYNNYIEPFNCVKELLTYSEFYQIDDNFLVNNAPYNFIEEIFNDFTNYVIALNLAKKSTFDPYSTHTISTLGNINTESVEKSENNFTNINSKAVYSEGNPNIPDFYKMIEIEKERRLKEIRNSLSCERKIKVFLKEDLEEKNKIAMSNAEFESFDGESSSLAQEFRELKKINEEKQKWNIVSETEYERLMKTPYFLKAVVRLRFPNDTQIQAQFASMETIGNIHNLIKEALENPDEDFYLFQFPPAKKFVNLSSTIFNEKLEPSTILYVNFPNVEPGNHHYKYIKDEFIEKYKCEYLIENKRSEHIK